MAGNIFGKLFRISTFGESHGAGIGVVIDGCPAGLELSKEDIYPYMDRRRPGKSLLATARSEEDRVEILSGVFEGKTTGTPIALLIRNNDQRSHDYSNIMDVYRPGHADFGFDMKYGFRDYRGGGRSSGRETAARVAAGAVAAKLLAELGITVQAECIELAGIPMSQKEEAEAKVLERKTQLDSAGGVVECRVRGLKPGIGEPVFDKLDARLAQAVMSIGAVKAVELGDGIAVAGASGSTNNDPFYAAEEGNPKSICKRSNHAGGILGGMSDGSELVLRASFKPTSSIAQKQQSVNRFGENVELVVKGRHDPTVVLRAVVVVECMTALTVLDCVLENMSARLSSVKAAYEAL